jgi:hexosaminidase
MYKKIISSLLFISISCLLLATNNPRYGIIPKPLMLKETAGEFKLGNNTKIVYSENNERVCEIAEDFAAQLQKTSGLSVKAVRQPQASDQIILRMTEGFAEEEYALSVTPQQIVVTASTPNGIFYGVQSICQLLPPQVYGGKKVTSAKWAVPCCEIRDAPRFSYRGLMLDCGRYFMPKETVMKFIDVMAMHKQNMFHWHLTEDQGWRIEIKKYPRLTEVGSMRKETTGYSKDGGDGKPHGGFYTQEDVKEVVEYARKRCVTVIPEIELPGHSSAAIAAYPELSCFPDREYEVATSWGIKKDVYCPTAATFRFLEDVFTELFDLFPSPYYHIGGDECPRDRWKESDYVQDLKKILGVEGEDQIQIFFVQRMAKFLREKGGKTVIGWDEILDGGAVPGTIVLSYRGHAPAMRATRLGMNTILTPNRWNYTDY